MGICAEGSGSLGDSLGERARTFLRHVRVLAYLSDRSTRMYRRVTLKVYLRFYARQKVIKEHPFTRLRPARPIGIQIRKNAVRALKWEFWKTPPETSSKRVVCRKACLFYASNFVRIKIGKDKNLSSLHSLYLSRLSPTIASMQSAASFFEIFSETGVPR